MVVIVSVEEDLKVSAREVPSGEESGIGALDFNRLRQQTIDVFVDRLVRNEGASRRELAILGEHLYDGLLTGDVEEFVRERLTKATPEQRVQLRLKLPYPDRLRDDLPSKLASYPWEYLYSYDLRTFVVQKASLVLSRYVAPRKGLGRIDCKEELRIGLVFANPSDPDLGVIDATELIGKVQALDALPGIVVARPPQPTPSGLTTFLKEFQPQVLHFIGHGGLERGEDEAKIVLVNPQGGSVDVPDYKLADYFEDAGHWPAIVLLDLPDPEGGEDDLERNTARLGPRLIRAGVPAVVAMQYPFPTDAACKFSVGFYGALADGEEIDVAVTKGRIAYQRNVAQATETRMLGTPVLYAQSHAAVRRAVAGRDDEPEPPPGTAADTQARPKPPAPERADTPSPEATHDSTVKVTRPASAANGSTTRDSWLRAVRFTGRTTMQRVGLSEESRARLVRWMTELENLVDETTTGHELADFIHNEWVTAATDDAQLKAVAEAVEATVRRATR
jgi:hypothetical protein